MQCIMASRGPREGIPGLELQSIVRVEVICIVDNLLSQELVSATPNSVSELRSCTMVFMNKGQR